MCCLEVVYHASGRVFVVFRFVPIFVLIRVFLLILLVVVQVAWLGLLDV